MERSWRRHFAHAGIGEGSETKFYPDDPLLREPAPRPVKQVANAECRRPLRFPGQLVSMPRREGRARAAWAASGARCQHLATSPTAPGTRTGTAITECRSRNSSADQATPRRPDAAGPVAHHLGQERRRDAGVRHRGRTQEPVRAEVRSAAFPGAASAADVIGSKAFYALGYNTPENYIVHFRRENWRSPGA